MEETEYHSPDDTPIEEEGEASDGDPNTADDEAILLSALAHYAYCPRRCGLIHVERIFQENVFTLRGRAEHERADEPVTRTETRREKAGAGSSGDAVEVTVRIERALPLWSRRYGLCGQGDVVEFFGDGRIAPVEYKPASHGANRRNFPGEVQMCAQALCLEEMYGRPVREGYLYSLRSHRRRIVAIDDDLRSETIAIIGSVRRTLRSPGALPPAVADARCPNCSLNESCVPRPSNAPARVGRRGRYIVWMIMNPPRPRKEYLNEPRTA